MYVVKRYEIYPVPNKKVDLLFTHVNSFLFIKMLIRLLTSMWYRSVVFKRWFATQFRVAISFLLKILKIHIYIHYIIL